MINFNDFGLLFLFHLNWNRWSSEYLFQLFLFLKSLKRIMQSKICTSFALLTPQSGDVNGIIACQEVGNGALLKSTH